ncbi:MAG: tRNA-dihydrouridine synthase [Planctomycetota bacterium]|nr:tRNA-dihydrouridine synthase [Planctomycetota bacterium]MCX8040445.1 tRNA-dihydrouridine synthase [Planctomycetota bacterium]MDW8373193.1 tRNA-dihydrouridine synthase [Planctomycetota bacterium]
MPDGEAPLPAEAAAAGSARYIHPLRIGDVQLANNLLLAPMAGYTNVAFRLIAKEVGGCGLVASEMVAAIGRPTAAQAERFGTLTRTVPAERPIAMQVYGREPELCAATAAALERAGADIIDLNCGCPVRKAKQAGCGVALMREPEQVGRIIAAMRRATSRPVTVKMRLGYDVQHRNAVEVALAAVENGASAVCVHARTGESKHGMPIDLGGVAAVRAALPPAIPVIANGSLDSAAAIRAAKDEAGADGYMIGRAACGDPWLFRNLIAELTGAPRYQPSLAERRALLQRHFDLILELYGEERGVRVMRKYAFFYCNGLPGVRRFRAEFCRIASRADFARVTADFFAALERGELSGPAEHLVLADDAADAEP